MFSQVFYSFTRSIDKQRPYSVLPPERMEKTNKQMDNRKEEGTGGGNCKPKGNMNM